MISHSTTPPKKVHRNVASGSTMVNKSSSYEYFRGKPWALGEGSLHDVNVGTGSSSSKSRVFFAHSKPWTESFSSSSCLTIFNPTESRINPKTNIHYLDYPHPNQPPTSFDLVFSCFFQLWSVVYHATQLTPVQILGQNAPLPRELRDLCTKLLCLLTV